MKLQIENIKAPYYRYEDIKEEVKKFRIKYAVPDEVPVDIEAIIEFKLKIDIVPLPGLRDIYEIESWLSSDFKTIYIDSDVYEKYRNRYVYSLAHEVGHYWLHKDLYNMLNFNTIEQWKKLIKEFPSKEYGWFETHAYHFAGILLVPSTFLKIEFSKSVALLEKQGYSIEDFNKQTLLEFISRRLADIFYVSQRVIEKRIDLENLHL